MQKLIRKFSRSQKYFRILSNESVDLSKQPSVFEFLIKRQRSR